MIFIYTIPSCSSCKKAELWFKAHDIEYKKINMLADKITAKDIMKMLSLTETGTEEIISRRSKAYQRLNRNLDNFTLDELINVIEENRTILRRPIIVDEKRIQVGYNDDDIRKFLPRTFREVKLKADYESIRQHMREAGELA